MTNSSKDNIYSQPRETQPFQFNQEVAEVFNDMINRSVPGYASILSAISELAAQKVRANSHCYDLGCSLGAVTLAISQHIRADNVKVFAVDNSAAMLNRAKSKVDAYKHKSQVIFEQSNIESIDINNADLVVLNFTLQFIEPESRQQLLSNIYKGLNPGGILVLSEKIQFEDLHFNQQMIDLHHRFKKQNGYSQLEISQKRNALEKVLLPDTFSVHQNRLRKAGFERINQWFQYFNFASILAEKSSD